MATRKPTTPTLNPDPLTRAVAQLAHEALANEWGDDAQIEAENSLFAIAEDRLSTNQWTALEEFCHRASTQERVAECVRQLRNAGVTRG